ncbi:MAG: hypothetical protein ACE5FU_01460 [Nitrospinota bacterium]
MGSRPKKRKIFLINKKFQLSILAYFAFVSLILILIFYISHIYLFGSLKLQIYAKKITDQRDLFILMEQFSSNMNLVFIFTALIAIAVTCISGIYISHRIAGPLYRFGLFLKAKEPFLSLKEMHFRKHDFFPELEESFNSFLRRNQAALKEEKKK